MATVYVRKLIEPHFYVDGDGQWWQLEQGSWRKSDYRRVYNVGHRTWDHTGSNKRRREPQVDAVRGEHEGGGESWTEAMSIVLTLNDAFYGVVDEWQQAKWNVTARKYAPIRTTAMKDRVYPTKFNDERWDGDGED